MSNPAQLTALFVGCYALGCVVGAYYLVRWRTGRDLRAVGSGNAGARNASRVLGKPGFVISLLIDAGKGAAATWIGLQMQPQPLAVVLAMMAVVAGHIWPAQLGFRGGKGAATALGIMIVFDPTATVVLLALGSLILIIVRRFTISGLAAIVLAPVVAAWLGHSKVEVGGLVLLAIAIVYAHRSNLSSARAPTGTPQTAMHQEPST